jgi:hypothetical protein
MGKENKITEISNYRKNCMGTLSFDMKTPSMRKKQDFIVYPIDQKTDKILIQSDTRIGFIMLDGRLIISKSYPNGAFSIHLSNGKTETYKLSDTQIEELKKEIRKTSGKNVGSVVLSDNSLADSI